MEHKLSAVSLFSGAGGMDVGFLKAGFDVLFANDIDAAACDTYNLNHSNKSHCGDLRDFRDTLSQFKDVDMVFGGPPCQGFSVAGKMDPEDERSKLIWSYLDKVELINPTAFVCENVKALAVNARWANVREKFLTKAEELGYTTALFVLNASHFGVPQARERMFIVGIKKQIVDLDTNAFLSLLQSEIVSKRRAPTPISELISNLGRAGSSKNNRTCSAIITYAKNPILRKSPYAGMLFNGAGRPINSHGVALTLPASMGGNKTPIIDEGEIFRGQRSFIENYHEHLLKGKKPKEGTAPNRLRRITVDEALAIQTFPEDYRLAGTQSAMYRQIGNAVPCELAEVVAECTKKLITKKLKANQRAA